MQRTTDLDNLLLRRAECLDSPVPFDGEVMGFEDLFRAIDHAAAVQAHAAHALAAKENVLSYGQVGC